MPQPHTAEPQSHADDGEAARKEEKAVRKQRRQAKRAADVDVDGTGRKEDDRDDTDRRKDVPRVPISDGRDVHVDLHVDGPERKAKKSKSRGKSAGSDEIDALFAEARPTRDKVSDSTTTTESSSTRESQSDNHSRKRRMRGVFGDSIRRF